MIKNIITPSPRLNQTNGFESEGAGSYMQYVRKAESRKIRLDHLKMGLGITLFLLFIVATNCLASEPKPWQILLQPPASATMESLEWFHNFLMFIITGIVFVVLALITYVCLRFNSKSNPVPATFSHNVLLEVIWTMIPIIILIIIAIPSFRILRQVDTPPKAELIVKVVGYQWYWGYEYPQHNIKYDSYMIPDELLKPWQKRLLDVDNRLVIPENTNVKFLITGADVIHSFALPSLGIKVDAIPGKTNETWTNVKKAGVYYGQCSELCGANHGFMPIALEVVSKEAFQEWITTQTKH